MKLKTSKVMAKMLNEKIKDFGLDYKITQKQITLEQFKLYVDFDFWEHENDYNSSNQKFNVLEIEYPLDYYACNRYLTTNDLIKIYKDSNKTFNGFLDSFKNYVEI